MCECTNALTVHIVQEMIARCDDPVRVWLVRVRVHQCFGVYNPVIVREPRSAFATNHLQSKSVGILVDETLLPPAVYQRQIAEPFRKCLV